MKPPASQIELWLRRNLLATTARLAERWCVEPAVRTAAR